VIARLVKRQLARAGFLRDFQTFRRLSASDTSDDRRLPLRWRDRHPCLDDRSSETPFDRHYVYHTSWAARVLAQLRPTAHVDVSSSLYFVGIASAFVPITAYDWRPANLALSNVTTGAADLTALPFADRSVPSLSCMHVLEHVGLGRYGDELDPDGDRRAMRELARVLAPGGSLLIVVPIGKPRICFNAHRIYAHNQILEAFAGFQLREFALIPDREQDGGLIVGASAALADAQHYGCGCFWLVRS
jgi:SAM-dependent methyltransferase